MESGKSEKRTRAAAFALSSLRPPLKSEGDHSVTQKQGGFYESNGYYWRKDT